MGLEKVKEENAEKLAGLASELTEVMANLDLGTSDDPYDVSIEDATFDFSPEEEELKTKEGRYVDLDQIKSNPNSMDVLMIELEGLVERDKNYRAKWLYTKLPIMADWYNTQGFETKNHEVVNQLGYLLSSNKIAKQVLRVSKEPIEYNLPTTVIPLLNLGRQKLQAVVMDDNNKPEDIEAATRIQHTYTVAMINILDIVNRIDDIRNETALRSVDPGKMIVEDVLFVIPSPEVITRSNIPYLAESLVYVLVNNSRVDKFPLGLKDTIVLIRSLVGVDNIVSFARHMIQGNKVTDGLLPQQVVTYDLLMDVALEILELAPSREAQDQLYRYARELSMTRDYQPNVDLSTLDWVQFPNLYKAADNICRHRNNSKLVPFLLNGYKA